MNTALLIALAEACGPAVTEFVHALVKELESLKAQQAATTQVAAAAVTVSDAPKS